MPTSHDNQLPSRSRTAMMRRQIPVVSELNAGSTPDQGLVDGQRLHPRDRPSPVPLDDREEAERKAEWIRECLQICPPEL